MATGMGEILHRSPRNAESFRIKRRAFHLVPPDGELLVLCFRELDDVSFVFTQCIRQRFLLVSRIGLKCVRSTP